jgi:hypothetical protein
LKKFKEYSFPITGETLPKLNFYANKDCNITKQEFDFFIKDNKDKYWIYLPYSKLHPDYFNYVTALKIPLNVNKSIVALIYFRAFIGAPSQGKMDAILAVFNKDGDEISKLPISGSYDDALDFDFKICSSEKIEINYTKYSDKGETKFTKCYYIREDGKIVLKD